MPATLKSPNGASGKRRVNLPRSAKVRDARPIPLEFDVDSRWFGRRFLDSEYERLIDTGIIKEGEPIELLDGILVRKMSKSPPHRIATRLARRILG